LLSMIHYDPNSANARYVYDLYGSSGTGLLANPPSFSWSVSSSGIPVGESKTYLHVAYGKVEINSYAPHGDFLGMHALGRSTARFFPLMKNNRVVIGSTATSGTGTIEYGLDRYNYDGSVDYDVLGANGPISAGVMVTTTLTADKDGMYAIWFKGAEANHSYTTLTINSCGIDNGAVNGTGTGGIWCFRAAPNLFPILGVFPSIKLYGSSLLYVNTDALMQRGGKIVQALLPPGRHWAEFVYPDNGTSPPAADSSHGFGLLDSYEDSRGRGAVNGSYNYVKPADDAHWTFQQHWAVDKGVLMDTFSPLDKDHSFAAFAITGDLTALNGYWEHATYLEATTTDTTRSTAVSKLDPVVMLELQAIIRDAPWESENPGHLAMIMGILKKVGNKLSGLYLQHAPKLRAIAEGVEQFTR